MVSPMLKREFEKRGVALLDPAEGRRAFWAEIQQERTDPAEVVIAASPQASLAAAVEEPPATASPLLVNAVRGSAGNAVQWLLMLDPAQDWYLRDHQLDGKGVLPLAFATELMAEAAHKAWPDLEVTAVRNLQLLKGIVVGEKPIPIEITVRMPVHGPETGGATVDVEIATPLASPALRYRAAVDLGIRAAGPEPFVEEIDGPVRPFDVPLGELYFRWTFHGPLFQRLTRVQGAGAGAVLGSIYSSSATTGLRDVRRASWSIDPYVFDAGLQLLLMWSRSQNDKTALPSRFRAFHRFGPLSDTPLTCHIRVESVAGGHAIRSDVFFVGPDGLVLGRLEGMEASCSAELNRVSGH
jgi:hypothetical protein